MAHLRQRGSQLLVDLVVHTTNDIGSPRVERSTSNRNATTRSGSVSASVLRPPPVARGLPTGSEFPTTSRTPRAIVSVCTPVAPAIALRGDPAPSQVVGLHTQHQTTLTLIQMRTQHRILTRYGLKHQNLGYFVARPKRNKTDDSTITTRG